MDSLAKLVYGADFFQLIPVFAEDLQVPGEGGAVAADIDHLFGAHTDNSIKKLFVAPFSGRIDDDDICPLSCPLIVFREDLFGLPDKELCIFYMVQLSVFAGILDRDGDDLHTLHSACLLCEIKRDGADPAVKVLL